MKNRPHKASMAGLPQNKMSAVLSSTVPSIGNLTQGGEEIVSDFVNAYAAATVTFGHVEVLRILGRLCQLESVRGLLQIMKDFGGIRKYSDEIELSEILCGLYQKEMDSELRGLIALLQDLH